MSNASGEGSDNFDRLGDIADILTDESAQVVSSQTPAISGVAAAAADSAFPVAALQYLIASVHTLTGLNWWADIAIATILVKGAALPFKINQIKASYKLKLTRQQMVKLEQELQTLILNMVDKVPSLKNGGAYWFTDLTTPDNLYILPLLASPSTLIFSEQEVSKILKSSAQMYPMITAVLVMPFALVFPKALLCYWITSNLFDTSIILALQNPEVRKFLGLRAKTAPKTSTSKS